MSECGQPRHTTPTFYLPFRLKELENAAFVIATTGASVTITDGMGGFYLTGPCDLPTIRQEIVHMQAQDRLLKPYVINR